MVKRNTFRIDPPSPSLPTEWEGVGALGRYLFPRSAELMPEVSEGGGRVGVTDIGIGCVLHYFCRDQ